MMVLRSIQSSFRKVHILVVVGGLIFGAGLSILTAIYYPVLNQEVRYALRPGSNNSLVFGRRDNGAKSIIAGYTQSVIHPLDEDFGIVIPKIGANSKVVENVSAYNEQEYQTALTKGVAHARDTAKPGEYGNTFIFAHSASNWYEANRYNAIFYLLTKLEKKDKIYLFYKGQKYVYAVSEKKQVDSDALEYLKQDNSKKTVTLMTCWPPGTTLKRLIVTAKITP